MTFHPEEAEGEISVYATYLKEYFSSCKQLNSKSMSRVLGFGVEVESSLRVNTG